MKFAASGQQYEFNTFLSTSDMYAEELMLLNCGVGEDSRESLGFKAIQPVHPKGDQS